MSAQQEIRTALWILAKIETTRSIDRDRLELASAHVRAALWKLEPPRQTIPPGHIGPCAQCGRWIDPVKGYIVSGPPSGVRCSDQETCLHRRERNTAATATPPTTDARDYIDTGQIDLADCPGYLPHCESERCPRCRHCGWAAARHERAAEPTDGAARG